jgi:hypothetical protein
MVHVLGSGGSPILLCSPVDARGFVGSGDAFSLDAGWPSADVLFEFPRRVSASAVLFGSPATHSVFDPDECDTKLYRYLKSSAASYGIALLEHVLVAGNMFRLMGMASGEET